MSKAYLQISGVLGNSAEQAHSGWIETVKLEVNHDYTKQPGPNGTAWARPIRVEAWTIQGPHDRDLESASGTIKTFASVVLEVVKLIGGKPTVKQRLRMQKVRVTGYQLNRDPGLIKPYSHFVLIPTTYKYEVGSSLKEMVEHEPAAMV